ncbi:MAG: PEP/pyruvate-binding domain-containing protein, partial [Planctomycetota bacterium]
FRRSYELSPLYEEFRDSRPRGTFLFEAAQIDGDSELEFVHRAWNRRSVHFYDPGVRPSDSGVPDLEFMDHVCTRGDFHSISRASSGETIRRIAKFIVPSRSDPPPTVPALVQNTRRYELHQDFLEAVFPRDFPPGSPEVYDRAVNRRVTRDYFVGNLYELELEDGISVGFDVLGAFLDDPRELPTLEELRSIYNTVSELVSLRPLVYYPSSELTREHAAGFENPGFPTILEGQLNSSDFVAYTDGVAYGRVRVLDLDGFEALNDSGAFGFQDILVLDFAPRDIEGVIAASVTTAVQAPLSHLAVRSARRGTPNAYFRNAEQFFQKYGGELVRLEIRDEGPSVSLASPEEAEEFWRSSRPQLSELPTVDSAYRELPTLAELDLEAGPESRVGGKATQFARLQRILSDDLEEYAEVGFAVPVAYYLDFLRENTIASYLRPGQTVSYEEYIREVSESPVVAADSQRRFEALATLRESMIADSQVDENFVRRLAVRTVQVFPTGSTGRVRFRSSSTVEDLLEFNGAGLYDSTSACAADDLDADSNGPSRCDRTEVAERGIARAVRRVWASLWNFRAYEERAFYGIPQNRAAMGILVTRAFSRERANGVIFSGNPASPEDPRYVVSVQSGERSVVQPDPGVLPEKNLLTIEGGQVAEIVRAVPSSLVPSGEHVLSDDQLRELGALVSRIEESFYVERARRDAYLLDIEFKIESNGDLAIKQVRPFLTGTVDFAIPDFEIDIEHGLEICDRFVPFRTVQNAYDRQIFIRFQGGTTQLREGDLEFDLISDLFFGPHSTRLAPRDRARLEVVWSEPGRYELELEQRFTLPDNGEIRVRVTNISVTTESLESVARVRVGLRDILSGQLSVRVSGRFDMNLGPCVTPGAARREKRIRARDGTQLVLREEIASRDLVAWVEDLAILEANVDWLDVVDDRRVTDPSRLIFAAARHMRESTYWTVLDPPVQHPKYDRGIAIVGTVYQDPMRRVRPASLFYYDEDRRLLGTSGVVAHTETPWSSGLFNRGDTDSNHRLELSDAVRVLRHLFLGAPPPPCEDAADADDDGRLSLSDPLLVLNHLFFRGVPLPPPGNCGVDNTIDELGCAALDSCMDHR